VKELNVILGREPAAWAAAFRALIAVIAGLWLPLTTDQQGALNALFAIILAAVVAASVKLEKVFALLVGVVEAIIYVAVSFGWNLSPDKQGLVVAAVAAIVAVIQRDRVVAAIDENGTPR
jgi:hypothetical protein